MRIEPTMRVRDIVRALPDSPRILSEFRIDFCCGGEQTLGEICQRDQLDFDEVAQELEATEAKLLPDPRGDRFDPRTASATDLVSRLLDRHHVEARRSLSTIGGLLPKVLAAHQERHPELRRVAELFDALARELTPHMEKEELHAFPAIVAAERGFRDRHGLDHAIRILKLEHELAGGLLHDLRAAAADYRPPDDACATWRALVRELAAFDAELIEHVSLENNFLLPLAQSLIGP